MKKCFRCQQTKNTSEFAKNSAKKDGLQERCRSCTKEHYSKDGRSFKQRSRRLFKIYGISELDYLARSLEQNNACAICGSVEPLFIDHCHTTGNLRGLLCNTCNSGIGLFKDSVENLKNAVNYLGEDYWMIR